MFLVSVSCEAPQELQWGPVGSSPLLPARKHAFGPGPIVSIGPLSGTGIWSRAHRALWPSYRHAGILQVHRHPTGKQTSYRYTDILQAYRHPTADILQVYVHASCRYTGILQVYSYVGTCTKQSPYMDTK